jgi:hypothetical protein
MSYYVTSTNLNYNVSAAKEVLLLKKHPDIMSTLEDEGFEVTKDAVNGGFSICYFVGESWRGQEEVLDDLAPFCEEGDGSSWRGEEEDTWTYLVEGGKHVQIDDSQDAAVIRDTLVELLTEQPELATKFAASEHRILRKVAEEVLDG